MLNVYQTQSPHAAGVVFTATIITLDPVSMARACSASLTTRWVPYTLFRISLQRFAASTLRSRQELGQLDPRVSRVDPALSMFAVSYELARDRPTALSELRILSVWPL